MERRPLILLDTHVWVWWVQGDTRLSSEQIAELDRRAENGIYVSVISCWEVAMLCERGRLRLPCSLDEWLDQGLAYPGVRLTQLDRSILVESCRLPAELHGDPADRMLIATALELDCPLITADQKLLDYEHCRTTAPKELVQSE